jgi:hypothetical protein
MEAFDPTQLGFARLQRFQFPGGVHVYEYANHPVVDGVPNFLRLNTYLSKDGSYVTIWRGLLEPSAAEAKLADAGMSKNFDLYSLYDETLFKGHIDSAEAATHILKALRIGQPGHHEHPQVLSVAAGSGLRCDFVKAID